MKHAIIALAACVHVACGDGTLHFGGDFSDDDNRNRTITTTGNVDNVAPPNSVLDLVIFVYSDLAADDLADGPPFTDFKDAESAVVDENGDFDLSKISSGNLTVIFLQDQPQPDGTIDPGDPCSVLVKAGSLRPVEGGRRVRLRDVDVGFRQLDCDDFNSTAPAATCFCSKAEEITVSLERENDG